jgi:hypothetical protein
MKTFLAALVVLFLVSSFTLAEDYQPLPFPQAANTALNGAVASSDTSNMPAAMASNQGGMQAVTAGSPFPLAANPSLGSTTEQSTPSPERQHDLGSPFPSDAAPSNR